MDQGSCDLNSSGTGSRHHEKESEYEKYSEVDTVNHSTAYTYSDGDSYSDSESGIEKDSDSKGISLTTRRIKESGSNRKRTSRISYSDLSYLNNLSKRERRRIEGEVMKGHKLGECSNTSHTIIDQHMT